MARTPTRNAGYRTIVPEGLPDNLLPIAQEGDRIHESALYSAQNQFEQMKLWRAMNLLLGLPAAVLAAIAGGTGLANAKHSLLAGILALIAAGFGAGITTLNPSRRVTQSQAGANAYLEIQTAARQFLTIDLAAMQPGPARKQLSELTSRRDEINKTADPPGWYARYRAHKVIAEGGQTYGADTAGT
jgi:hypothetical protein